MGLRRTIRPRISRNIRDIIEVMFSILDPKGPIAMQEKGLIITAVSIMLIIVVPVLVALVAVVWKYRAGNKGAKREGNPDDRAKNTSFAREAVWWIFPSIIVAILGVITWKSAHALDPSQAVSSNVKPLTIQVVALDWKWLFIYPQQNIATVNFIQFPTGTPLNFELTADGAPMNGFWIPQLGGQEYAMAGMTNQLHLMATAPGVFTGQATEINGQGFAGMKFEVKATSQNDFDAWVASVRRSAHPLTLDEYNNLVEPSQNNPQALYSSVQENLYGAIVAKFMAPGMMMSSSTPSSSMPDMQNMPANMPGMKM